MQKTFQKWWKIIYNLPVVGGEYFQGLKGSADGMDRATADYGDASNSNECNFKMDWRELGWQLEFKLLEMQEIADILEEEQ